MSVMTVTSFTSGGEHRQVHARAGCSTRSGILHNVARPSPGPRTRSQPVILSDRDIRKQIENGRVVIEPFDDAAIQPSSIDLHVDDTFRIFANSRYPYIDVKKRMDDLTEEVRVAPDEPFILHPGEFVLGSTLEKVTLPDDVVARIEGKSSPRPARSADPLDGRVRRRRLVRSSDARAVERGEPSDHDLPGDEDRTALPVRDDLAGRPPVRRARQVPRPARPDAVPLLRGLREGRRPRARSRVEASLAEEQAPSLGIRRSEPAVEPSRFGCFCVIRGGTKVDEPRHLSLGELRASSYSEDERPSRLNTLKPRTALSDKASKGTVPTLDNKAFHVLGIEPTGDGRAIRAAFLRLARIYHPDRFAGQPDDVRVEAERRMKEATVAYEALRGTRQKSAAAPALYRRQGPSGASARLRQDRRSEEGGGETEPRAVAAMAGARASGAGTRRGRGRDRGGHRRGQWGFVPRSIGQPRAGAF